MAGRIAYWAVVLLAAVAVTVQWAYIWRASFSQATVAGSVSPTDIVSYGVLPADAGLLTHVLQRMPPAGSTAYACALWKRIFRPRIPRRRRDRLGLRCDSLTPPFPRARPPLPHPLRPTTPSTCSDRCLNRASRAARAARSRVPTETVPGDRGPSAPSTTHAHRALAGAALPAPRRMQESATSCRTWGRTACSGRTTCGRAPSAAAEGRWKDGVTTRWPSTPPPHTRAHTTRARRWPRAPCGRRARTAPRGRCRRPA
jgi:hypothetical protein